MKVLLTGAAGFIGSAVAAELCNRGNEVVALDAFIPQAHGSHPDRPVHTHNADVRDPAAMLRLLDGVQVVCHQAAVVGAGATVSDLPLYASHNDLGTAVLLAAMASREVGRLVLASSMVVYGEGRYTCRMHGDQAPPPRGRAALDAGRFDNPCPVCAEPLDWGLVDEDARLDPRSSYAASKVAQEHYAAAWARQVSGSVIALRYHNVYGPGMPRDTPYSGAAASFRSAVERGEPPAVFEDGKQMRDFVHVSDVAVANALAVEAVADASAEAFVGFNICSGTPVCVADVARFVAAGSADAMQPRVTGTYRIGDVRHIVASPAKAYAQLGFAAGVDPRQGLDEFANVPLRG
ncbi:MAG: NAD-dependent epimerase/dehydratase family protein [Nocardioidaceae bacterium]